MAASASELIEYDDMSVVYISLNRCFMEEDVELSINGTGISKLLKYNYSDRRMFQSRLAE